MYVPSIRTVTCEIALAAYVHGAYVRDLTIMFNSLLQLTFVGMPRSH